MIKVGNFLCFGLFDHLQGDTQQKIFREISNKNLKGRFRQKSSGRYSTKIFREVFDKNLQGRFQQISSGRYSTKIFRDVSTKNLQEGIQQKSSGRYSTKVFREVFDKESSLLNTSQKMAEKGRNMLQDYRVSLRLIVV
jgi:hypothetical protein